MKRKRGVIYILFLFLCPLIFSAHADDARIKLDGFVLVEAGTFRMGSTSGDNDEKPVHRVRISRDYYMGRYEVTQKQWCDVMGGNPSYMKGDNHPVEEVSWYDAVEYCNRLSVLEDLTPCYSGSGDNIRCDFSANGYRLPTEAEWEYAARGGNRSRGYVFAGSDEKDVVGWCGVNSRGATHVVGQKKPNELELYDMSGNVWEWCWDRYGSKYYSSSSSANPRGPSTGSRRVDRGGCWCSGTGCLRVANRRGGDPSYGYSVIGFRLVRTAP